MGARSHYEQLAKLFDYPQDDVPRLARGLLESLRSDYPVATAALERFVHLLPGGDEVLTPDERDEVQELFTRSFQVQAATTLDIGFIAFGDDYKRAELLVNLKREQRLVDVDCGSELADHLPNILRLIARWADEDTCEEFVDLILHPSLEKMVEEFGSERMELRNALYKKHHKTLIVTSQLRAKMYQYALQALLEVVREDFRLDECDKPEKTSDFLRHIGREMDIEARGEGHRPAIGLPQRPTKKLVRIQ